MKKAVISNKKANSSAIPKTVATPKTPPAPKPKINPSAKTAPKKTAAERITSRNFCGAVAAQSAIAKYSIPSSASNPPQNAGVNSFSHSLKIIR